MENGNSQTIGRNGSGYLNTNLKESPTRSRKLWRKGKFFSVGIYWFVRKCSQWNIGGIKDFYKFCCSFWLMNAKGSVCFFLEMRCPQKQLSHMTQSWLISWLNWVQKEWWRRTDKARAWNRSPLQSVCLLSKWSGQNSESQRKSVLW